MKKIFIDGSAGTTGLRIRERLSHRRDIELITIPEALRKEDAARREYLNEADIAFLCLPDAAAKEAAAMTGSDTVLIDTSTAHRTSDAWAYGFPELKGLREKIQGSNRIANPGCHASGFISLVAPLVREGLVAPDARLSCFSLTGYSGGGKKMIGEYESDTTGVLMPPRMYGLSQTHKHLPEMQKLCGLAHPPIFSPIVSSYYAGMEVTVSLYAEDLKVSVAALKDFYRSYYTGKLVRFREGADENGFVSAGKMAGFDDMEISVYGNDDRILLVSRFDNLGKGASGAAIQNMNLVLGLEETTGLNLSEE